MVTKKSLSISYENIGIKIHYFGFVNSHRNPRLNIEIANFDSSRILQFNVSNFKLIIKTDTLSQESEPDAFSDLPLGERKRIMLSYDYEFGYKTEYGYVQTKPPGITYLLIEGMTLGEKQINLPLIEFHLPGKRFL